MPLTYRYKGNFENLSDDAKQALHSEFPTLLMVLGIGVLNSETWDEFKYRLSYMFHMKKMYYKEEHYNKITEIALELVPTVTNVLMETRLEWYKRVENEGIKLHGGAWKRKIKYHD